MHLKRKRSTGGTINTRSGFVLITMAVSSVVLFGMLGLALDLGHVFIAKNEAQVYTDSAAAAAALRLDGTIQGVSDAANEVTSSSAPANANGWNLATSAFTNTQVEFSTSAAGPWVDQATAASAPDGVGFARVTTTVTVPLYILPVVVAATSMDVNARSVAGQVPATPPPFPYTPMAHDRNDPVNFGLVPGNVYTIRWGAGFNGGCSGDKGSKDPVTGLDWNVTARNRAGGSADLRGFYGSSTNASTIRAEIVDDYAITVYHVGDFITMQGGADNTEGSATQARVGQDSDTTAPNYTAYNGNGRRIIAVPVTDADNNNKVLGYRAFLLLPVQPGSNYAGGGGSDWCAVYMGSYNDGSRHKAAIAGGAFKTRLVQ